MFALFLGAIVGIERELTQKSAGMRTHMLVCLGATIFTLISVSELWKTALPTGPLPSNVHLTIVQDPGRIAAQIVTGIGFIGGGALLRYGTSIRGVTTAASLWLMASVGMLVGIGALTLAMVATGLAIVVLFSLGRLERLVLSKDLTHYRRIHLTVKVAQDHAQEVAAWLDSTLQGDVVEIDLRHTQDEEDNSPLAVYQYQATVQSKRINWSQWRHKLERRPGVRSLKLSFLSERDSD